MDYPTCVAESGPWPTDRSGADHVKITVDESEAETTETQIGEGESGFNTSLLKSNARLDVHQIQDLADEVAEIASICAPYDLSFRLEMTVDSDGTEIPDDVKDKLNDVLRRVSDDLAF